MLDALDVLEGRLNRELPANWRNAYDYADGPMGAVHEAWADTGIEPDNDREGSALGLLESYLFGEEEFAELNFHDEQGNWVRAAAGLDTPNEDEEFEV